MDPKVMQRVRDRLKKARGDGGVFAAHYAEDVAALLTSDDVGLSAREVCAVRAGFAHAMADRLPKAMIRQAKDGAKDGDLKKRFEGFREAAILGGVHPDQADHAALADLLIAQAFEVESVLKALEAEEQDGACPVVLT